MGNIAERNTSSRRVAFIKRRNNHIVAIMISACICGKTLAE